MSKYYPKVVYNSWEKSFTVTWMLDRSPHVRISLAPKTFDSPVAVQTYLIECCKISPIYEVTLKAEIEIQRLFTYTETWMNYQGVIKC